MDQENKNKQLYGDQNQVSGAGQPGYAAGQGNSKTTIEPGSTVYDEGNIENNPDRIADIDDLHEIQVSDDLQEPDPEGQFSSTINNEDEKENSDNNYSKKLRGSPVQLLNESFGFAY